jgi:hypothetical protein
MTTYPGDIMKAANECVAEFRWNNDNRWHLFVAAALLKERQRCAAAARAYLEDIAGCSMNDDEPEQIESAILAGEAAKRGEG